MSIRAHGRYRTPPHTSDLLVPRSAGSDKTSRRSPSFTASPSSIDTHPTTPPRSPAYFQGREILPRIRKQDQMIDPIITPSPQYHKDEYNMNNALPMNYHHYVQTRPFGRRSVSPAELAMITPVSTVSYPDVYSDWSRHSPPPTSLEAPMACGAHSRSISTSSMPKYGYTNVTSAPDDKFIPRYAYPTYRQAPVYTTAGNKAVPANWASSAQSSTIPQVVVPQAPLPGADQYPAPLSPELIFDSYAEAPPTTNLLEYLTQPNPSPAIVRRLPNTTHRQDTHFWWDVRNIRPWSDFTLDTIKKIPGLTKLLESDIPEPALPTPVKGNLHPDTLSALQDAHTAHYLVKVNAALKVSLGAHHHLIMRATKPSRQAGATEQPDYVANHSDDIEVIPLGGQPRGRVIGLVRSYEQWNSGMRADSPTAKITYLRELAHLQRYMREHSCRYGFIITEIELICVRMGSQVGSHPVFGLLELATPIQLNVDGKDKLTAPLALWYLHMLAKNAPLPGQCPWKVEIGPPAELSRKNVIAKDTWINLKPECKEKRDAKRNRGWVFPEDTLSRRELGRPRRWTKKMERERQERAGHGGPPVV